MWYICKASKPSKGVLMKLYFSCKYFWPQLHTFPISSFTSCDEVKTVSMDEIVHHRVPRNQWHLLDIKFHLFGAFIFIDSEANPVVISHLLKLWRFEMSTCILGQQILTIDEYKLIMSSVRKLRLEYSRIMRPDMSGIVTLDELIIIGPKVSSFTLWVHFSSLVVLKKHCVSKNTHTIFIHLAFEINSFSIPHDVDSRDIYSPTTLHAFWDVITPTKLVEMRLYQVQQQIDYHSVVKFIKVGVLSLLDFCLLYVQCFLEQHTLELGI